MKPLKDMVSIGDFKIETVDPFGLCPDPNKEQVERELYAIKIASIEATITELQLQKDILDRKVKEICVLIEKEETRLRTACRHEDLETEERYFEGSYLDKAYTKRRNVCKTCGTCSEWVTETLSWYG